MSVSFPLSRKFPSSSSLLGLFHSKKIITIENLYLFFNLKRKHLVICFTVHLKGNSN